MGTKYFIVSLVTGTVISVFIGWLTGNWFWFWLPEVFFFIASCLIGAVRWYYCKYELGRRPDDDD
ncbi:MAG: hypothetical protein UY52_C0018G0003 [Parcubacteria group bacterium GW2011_GWC2_49_9]|nr:MAG: hypothetical protein UY52_C0018G0003 [Parcubacteria group bacterium GW2011_GWC2_49_9]